MSLGTGLPQNVFVTEDALSPGQPLVNGQESWVALGGPLRQNGFSNLHIFSTFFNFLVRERERERERYIYIYTHIHIYIYTSFLMFLQKNIYALRY